MTEDSEKRFQKIMDKLYRFPRSKPSPSSGGVASSIRRGMRMESSSRGSLEIAQRNSTTVTGSREFSQAQQCRPWDRGDLMRRMSTFKAMTWFGKPKAISPVNCARRGWINVDMDTIACEACGSRLLFSTPSSWAFHQVEKAAAVFSLKLDNGHKLLCPWTDNICDESLAFFPPTPSTVLVEGYKERALALLQLSALPLISQSAIKYMKSPQLEHLLGESASITCVLNKHIRINDKSCSMPVDFVPEAGSANIYFQAQKIISLCGWELRFLPYFVDCEVQFNGSLEKVRSDSGHLIGERNQATVLCSSNISLEAEGEKNEHESFKNQSEPASAALDCKLCGACVGLWTFNSTPRPLEHFRLYDSSDVNNQNGAGCVVGNVGQVDTMGTWNQDASCMQSDGSSSLSIAGGLPPAKQNFRPRVSLPIISRHLRATLSTTCDVRNQSPSIFLENNQTAQHLQQDNQFSQNQNVDTNCDAPISTGNTETLKRKRTDSECCNTFQLSGDIIDSHSHNAEEGKLLSSSNPACVFNALNSRAEIRGSDLVIESTCTHNESNRLSRGKNSDQAVTSQDSHHDSVDISTAANADADEDTIINTGLQKGVKSLDSQSFLETNTGINAVSGLKRTVIQPGNSQYIVPNLCSNLIPLQQNSLKEFDPIGQHRPFCPWITSEDGAGMPGWKLMLTALVQERDPSPALLKKAPLKSADEVDDPIECIRKLFTSPPSKKLKGST